MTDMGILGEINIRITDNGQVFVSAPDHYTDGHTFMVQDRYVSLKNLSAICDILGSPFPEALKARHRRNISQLESKASVAQAAYEKAEEARVRLEAYRSRVTEV